MKLHGYCATCHKIRRVTVRNYIGHGVPKGTCDECNDKTNTTKMGVRK